MKLQLQVFFLWVPYTMMTSMLIISRNKAAAAGFSTRYAGKRQFHSGAGFSTRYTAQQRFHSGVPRLCAEPPSQLPPQAVQSLLRGALSRAKRTLSEKDEAYGGTDDATFESRATADSSSSSSSSQLLSVFAESSANTESSPSVSSSQRLAFANELLGGIASRAKRTLSTKAEYVPEPPTTPTSNQSHITAEYVSESSAATTSKETTITPTQDTNSKPSSNKKVTPTDLRYSQNPALSFTALAHWLWASVLRPHEDTAIDATCGNGHDAAGIASILMGNEELYLHRNSELICIDIQEEACRATEERLSEFLHPTTIARSVRMVVASHAYLPAPKDPSSVGLVVYNLGYLPNSDKALQTTIESTVSSIADALLLIRVGGMVSIMTYPASNKDEDFVVRTLLEAVVVMTNKKGPDWYTFIDQLDCSSELKEMLRHELRRISSAYEETSVRRTFRVSEHKKVGLAQAPILMTSTRIK